MKHNRSCACAHVVCMEHHRAFANSAGDEPWRSVHAEPVWSFGTCGEYCSYILSVVLLRNGRISWEIHVRWEDGLMRSNINCSRVNCVLELPKLLNAMHMPWSGFQRRCLMFAKMRFIEHAFLHKKPCASQSVGFEVVHTPIVSCHALVHMRFALCVIEHTHGCPWTSCVKADTILLYD